MPLAIPFAVAAVTAGATIYSANKASSAAKNATAAQTASNADAIGEQRREYDQTRTDQAPWRSAGQAALAQIAQTHGITINANGTTTQGAPNNSAFYASPDYQFRVDQGTRAITANRAARGLLDSGSLGQGLIDYGQAAGSQEYGNWYNRLSALAGVGQTATQATDAAGQNSANNISGILTNQGNQQASSIATQGGIQAGLINQLGNTASGLIQNWPTSGSSAAAIPASSGGSLGSGFSAGGGLFGSVI